uniref:Uncharacterized protein n=1 Tax=Arundo donax TaxID=35708 RepID=A0A0A9A098_ARUDO
MNELSFCHTF